MQPRLCDRTKIFMAHLAGSLRFNLIHECLNPAKFVITIATEPHINWASFIGPSYAIQ